MDKKLLFDELDRWMINNTEGSLQQFRLNVLHAQRDIGRLFVPLIKWLNNKLKQI